MTTRHILIVNGEPEITFLLSGALERSNRNYCISTAHSGAEALEVFKRSPVDLLVTDQWAPESGGLELISWAREYSPQTLTVLIAADGCGGIEAKARRLGVNHCLTKPFDAHRFVETVQNALHSSGKGPALANEPQTRELLASLVFHELRTPLTHVMGYAEFLAEQSQGPHREWVQTIQRCTRRMREVLDDVTLMAEWSLRWAAGHTQPTNLHHVLEVVVAQLTALVMEKRQTLWLAPTSEPIWLTTDAWLLGVLFNALISNVIKCTPERGEICVSAGQEGETAVVTVRGDSDGAYDETGVSDGSGIGLTVACKLSEALGGRLQIESGERDGATFRLVFPMGFPPPEKVQWDAGTGQARVVGGPAVWQTISDCPRQTGAIYEGQLLKLITLAKVDQQLASQKCSLAETVEQYQL
jgi:signal transduction histidine kinase